MELSATCDRRLRSSEFHDRLLWLISCLYTFRNLRKGAISCFGRCGIANVLGIKVRSETDSCGWCCISVNKGIEKRRLRCRTIINVRHMELKQGIINLVRRARILQHCMHVLSVGSGCGEVDHGFGVINRSREVVEISRTH